MIGDRLSQKTADTVVAGRGENLFEVERRQLLSGAPLLAQHGCNGEGDREVCRDARGGRFTRE